MNLIKVLLRTLASAQPCAVSQGDYSYLGFEPLPNHVKNYRDMWNSAFPVTPRSVNKPDSRRCSAPLFTAVMSSKAEARLEMSRRRYLWKLSHVDPPGPRRDSKHAAREAVCTAILIQQLTGEKWPQTGQQQSIKACLTFEPQSYNTLFFHPAMFEQRLCLHRTILTERGAEWKKEKVAPLIKDWHKKGSLSYSSTALFSSAGKSPPTACVRYPTQTRLICGKIIYVPGVWKCLSVRRISQTIASDKQIDNSWWKTKAAFLSAHRSEVRCFQWGVKVELGSTCVGILPLEKFGKKEKKKSLSRGHGKSRKQALSWAKHSHGITLPGGWNWRLPH